MIISIAVVALNEAKTLPRLLSDILNQDYPHSKTEILLIDSMSTDDTAKIMEDFCSEQKDFYYGIKVLKNENKTLPYGCNIMLRNYSGDAIVRIDAHASVPSDFISKNVAALLGGEMVSGGRRPNIIDEETPFKLALNIAESALFGSGFAAYRNSNKKQYVSSIFHGMYRREVYDTVGFYNVNLSRSEDNDMSERINRAGFKMCYDPEIVSYQHTRSTLPLMLRQKFLNGYWIAKTLGVNPRCISPFHFVPFLFVMAIIVTSILAAFGIWQLSALLWSAYTLFILVNSVFEIIKNEFHIVNLLLPVLFFLLHISYGIGTVKGLIEMPFWVRKLEK
ncbi:MAG: glycosyltransferase family 2 protein [Clostridia bacterium]|nr:glycosyltransferase family 2 protein [Clostridia bacterium]